MNTQAPTGFILLPIIVFLPAILLAILATPTPFGVSVIKENDTKVLRKKSHMVPRSTRKSKIGY